MIRKREYDVKMSKDFIYGAEDLIDLIEKRLIENGRLCQDCRKEIGDLCETLRERIRDKKLEKLELELEL